MALRPFVEVEPWEWTETHEPWHLETLDLGNRTEERLVLGREYRISERHRFERVYVKREESIDDGNFEAPKPLSGMREMIFLQTFRIATLVVRNDSPAQVAADRRLVVIG